MAGTSLPSWSLPALVSFELFDFPPAPPWGSVRAFFAGGDAEGGALLDDELMRGTTKRMAEKTVEKLY